MSNPHHLRTLLWRHRRKVGGAAISGTAFEVIQLRGYDTRMDGMDAVDGMGTTSQVVVSMSTSSTKSMPSTIAKSAFNPGCRIQVQ